MMKAFLILSALLSAFALTASCDFDDNDFVDDAANDDSGEGGTDDDTAPEILMIDREALEDRILGSWVGQMAGVAWGASTEFKYHGRIIPDDRVPKWRPRMINWAFLQDDLYAEIPFMDAMAERGPTATWTDFGEAFRNTFFPLMHANRVGRKNLRHGIPAPDSGHYLRNRHCEDIDWQIEADFIGALCPGRPNAAIDIAWRAGHVMTYGDGTYGGVFLAAMHAAAFFAESLDEIIDAGLASLPEGSKYRQVVENVLEWHGEGLTWEETWQRLQDKWAEDDRCPSNDNNRKRSFDIDAKLNGAYVLIGLLYGEGDFGESMRIAMRCGQDSDCNPSSVGGILGNWYGFEGIPDEFKSALNLSRRFLFTDYTLDRVLKTSLDLAERIVFLTGGSVEADGTWLIPKDAAVAPPILEQWPVEANPPPQLSAFLLSQNGLTIEVEAFAEDADGIAEYEWYFGDLSRISGPRATHTYSAPGAYQVISYAADSIGNTAWQTIEVTVIY